MKNIRNKRKANSSTACTYKKKEEKELKISAVRKKNGTI